MTKSLVVDAAKCTGCGSCELACSLANTGEFDLSRSRIQVLSFEPDFERVPIVCRQCYRPACAEICPTDAISRDEATGIVKVSPERCNGCAACEEACPFGAIAFSGKERKAVKCELCGGSPQCVGFCTIEALTFQDREQVNYARRRAAAERLK